MHVRVITRRGGHCWQYDPSMTHLESAFHRFKKKLPRASQGRKPRTLSYLGNTLPHAVIACRAENPIARARARFDF
jgi:hypothetical protein